MLRIHNVCSNPCSRVGGRVSIENLRPVESVTPYPTPLFGGISRPAGDPESKTAAENGRTF